MTTEQVKTMVKQHRRSAIYGGIGGLVVVLIFGGWAVLEIIRTPNKPNVHTASQTDIVAYVANSRGLDRLAQIEQERFLRDWKDTVMPDAERRSGLAAALGSLDDLSRKSFGETVMKHMKRDFMQDAERYDQIRNSDEVYAFLRERHAEYGDNALFMKEVGAAFRNDLDSSPEKVQEWVIGHTNAEERALGESYVEALKSVKMQIRREQSAAQTPPDDSSDETKS